MKAQYKRKIWGKQKVNKDEENYNKEKTWWWKKKEEVAMEKEIEEDNKDMHWHCETLNDDKT